VLAVLAYFLGSTSVAALACGHSAHTTWDVLATLTRRIRRHTGS
jgi:hypothetical protein